MLVVALTGGIGCGKSLVSDHFAALGVPVIDTDVIAREQVAPGSPALREIHSVFGPAVMTPDGTLNRAKLRELVFDASDKRQRLEQILHPLILGEMERRLKSLTAPYVVVVIPLLLETGQNSLVDRVLVIDCDEALQISRVKERNGLTEQQILQIMSAQVDRATRLAAADDVIENNGGLDELIEATDRLHAQYLQLAGNGS